MSEKLRFESSINPDDKIQLDRNDETISITQSYRGNMLTIELTPFEAQTIASAMLQMAAKLEAPHDVFDKEMITREALSQVVEPIKQANKKPLERTIRERIEKIWHLETGDKKLELSNGMEVMVSADIWQKESHLQSDYEGATSSSMNIRMNERADWELVDCLPF